MTIQDICQHSVDTAGPGESAFQAAERMHQRTVGALVVVDDAGTPVGIVTDRDLALRVVAAGRDAYSTPVREVMTPQPKTAPAATSIEDALSTMRAGAFRRLPIVDKHGHLAGLVALDDIVVLLSKEIGRVGRVLKQEMPQAAGARAK